MMKLIASDLDGTILLNGAQSVDASLIDVVSELAQKGYIFAPASGRQIASLKMLFHPLEEQLMYIGENGALVKYKNQTIVKNSIERNLALEIIEDVCAHDNCEVLVSGEEVAYIKPKTKEYYHRMTQIVKYKTQLVEDFCEIPEDILKIAVCDLSGIKNSQEYFHKRWDDAVNVAVSGELYLDFMAKNVSKGHAMQQVQQELGIAKDECMAFGDNFNDIEMLDAVGHAYVMEQAVAEIQKHKTHSCAKVEDTLRALMAQGIL